MSMENVPYWFFIYENIQILFDNSVMWINEKSLNEEGEP